MADITPDDLDSLKDMFGEQSPALQEQLQSARGSALDQILSKPNVEDTVSQQSVPGYSAEDAAETLAPKELPVPTSEVYNTKNLRGAAKLANAAEGEAGKGIIELGPDAYSTLPEVAESGGLPAVIEKGGLPAIIEKMKTLSPEAAQDFASKFGGKLGAALRSALGGAGEDMLGPLALGYEALRSPEAGGPQDYPPNLPTAQKDEKDNRNIFDMVSNKYDDLQAKGRIGDRPAPNLSSMVNAASQDGQPNPQDASKDPLKDLLAKIYGPDLTDDALKQAQQQRNTRQAAGDISKAGNTIASALAAGRGGNIKPQNEVADDLIKQADQPIQDIQQRRAAKMQELEAGLKASDLMDHEKLRDATSAVSEAYRNMALQLNPKLAGVPNFEQMNAEGIKQLLPMVDLSIKSQVAKDNHTLAMAQKQQLDSGKAKSEMGRVISTTMNRGTPAQASNSVLAADKIMDLFKGKPDPSQWNSDEVHLFKTETEKLAKGGIPSEAGTKALIPGNIASTFASIAQGVTGDVIGTHQGELIKNLIPYVQNVRQTSADYVRDNVYKPIMNSYNKRLSPGDFEDYKRDLPDYIFPKQSPTVTTQAMTKGNVPSSTLKQYATKHGISEATAASMLKTGGYNVEGY